MLARFLPTLAVILCIPTFSIAQKNPQETPQRSQFTLGLGQLGYHFQMVDAVRREEKFVPYSFLTVPHFVYTCTRLTVALLKAESDKNAPAPSAKSVDSGVLHLYEVAKRCEESGDIDMACNCYTEIVRLRPDCELATSAEFQCRRLQLVNRAFPGLERNNRLSTSLPR